MVGWGIASGDGNRFTLRSLACGLAGSMMGLIAARVVQGLGGGGLMVLSQALIGELVSPIDRPRYQGYFAVVFTAVSVGGPLIGGVVVHHADWRWLFLANLPICALAAWRVSQLPTILGSTLRRAPADLLGVLLFAMTATCGLLWMSFAGHRFAWWSSTSGLLAALSAATGYALIRQQRRHAHPFLPLEILRLPGVAWICGPVVCFAGGMFALLFLLPIYFQLVHGIDAASAGMQMLPLTAGLVFGAAINGRITIRTLLPGRIPPFGLAAAAIALLVLAVAPLSLWTTGVAIAIVGMGLGTVMPSAQLTTQTLAGRDRLGAATALLALARSAGAVGVAGFGALSFTLLRMAPGDLVSRSNLGLAAIEGMIRMTGLRKR